MFSPEEMGEIATDLAVQAVISASYSIERPEGEPDLLSSCPAIRKRAFLPVGNLPLDLGQNVLFVRKILGFYLTMYLGSVLG